MGVRSKRLSKTDSEVEQENINAAQSSEAATEDTTEGAAAASETNQEEPVQTSSTEAAEGAEAQAVTEAEEISEIDLQTGSSELEQLPPPLETVTVPEEIRESVEKLRKNLAACEDLALSDNLEDLGDTDAEVPLEAEEEAEQADTELSEPETGNDQEEAGGG